METSLDTLSIKIQRVLTASAEDAELLVTSNFGLGLAIFDYSMNSTWTESLSPCCQARVAASLAFPGKASCDACEKMFSSDYYFFSDDLNGFLQPSEFFDMDVAMRLATTDPLLAVMATAIFCDVVKFLLRSPAVWSEIKARSMALPAAMDVLEGCAARVSRV